jgi:hypothetical protein
MSKWIRRGIALLSAGMLLNFGGCLNLGGLFNLQRIYEAALVGNLFD